MSQNGPCLWTGLPQSSPAPCERFKLACCSHQHYVYVLGGRHSTCQRDFWRYNVVCNEWTELNCTSEAAPEALEEHSMVAHEGFLFVFGGMLDSAYTSLRCPLWVFDIMRQKWVQWRGKSPQAESPSNRKAHSAVVIESAMLVYGGYIDLKGSSQEFWSLDLDSMVWSPVACSPQTSLGPGPRHSHSSTAFGTCMYLYGGLKGLREQRDFWMWNSTSSTWSSLRTKSGPSKLVGHSAVTYKDCMLVFGGCECQNSPQNCLWRYNFFSQSWNQITTLPGSDPPHKVHHCCVGLGPSYCRQYEKSTLNSEIQLNDKIRRFKNKCFPTQLSFLGSENAIELQMLTPQKSTSLDNKEKEWRMDCLTFENKAFRNRLSFEKELDENISQNLPDMLLVIGGRPYTLHKPISVWQMTLTDS
ncbi:leucine-zipper-like transcriptional regulator 1 homolog [Periophthalmus magnuspinnatus]|uniref:leucine-zipper-like transcriptional regulator 1 homolog n=1 Tax=Periophthalmus magnuspinnatus TaxID=409849 RepID=UPI00145B59BE|nr:leucine-zipper-like transcriptional regulator 1 homolog [Periophthalmus magnuspinnatus]XP_055086454.1 leucine-zipper-like transcriptional regulator 1 homolog [Periophthalmus magnuspinnatus]